MKVKKEKALEAKKKQKELAAISQGGLAGSSTSSSADDSGGLELGVDLVDMDLRLRNSLEKMEKEFSNIRAGRPVPDHVSDCFDLIAYILSTITPYYQFSLLFSILHSIYTSLSTNTHYCHSLSITFICHSIS
jgi:hypothetical protein